MGGRWIKYNKMTERWEFLHVKTMFSEVFSQDWEKVSEWMQAFELTIATT